MTHPSGTTVQPIHQHGFWVADGAAVGDAPQDFAAAIGDLRSPAVVVRTGGVLGIARGGTVTFGRAGGVTPPVSHEVVASPPPLAPEQLGDPTFLEDHAIRYPYMTGAMANGIGSADIVEAMGRA